MPPSAPSLFRFVRCCLAYSSFAQFTPLPLYLVPFQYLLIESLPFQSYSALTHPINFAPVLLLGPICSHPILFRIFPSRLVPFSFILLHTHVLTRLVLILLVSLCPNLHIVFHLVSSSLVLIYPLLSHFVSSPSHPNPSHLTSFSSTLTNSTESLHVPCS